jgi:hypothetical protein
MSHSLYIFVLVSVLLKQNDQIAIALGLRVWPLGFGLHAVDRVQQLCLFGKEALKRFLALVDDLRLPKIPRGGALASALELAAGRGSLHFSISPIHMCSSSSWTAFACASICRFSASTCRIFTATFGVLCSGCHYTAPIRVHDRRWFGMLQSIKRQKLQCQL